MRWKTRIGSENAAILYHEFIIILPVMKPYTIKWPLKSGFAAYVMFKTLGNLFCILLLYQHFFNIDIKCPHE